MMIEWVGRGGVVPLNPLLALTIHMRGEMHLLYMSIY